MWKLETKKIRNKKIIKTTNTNRMRVNGPVYKIEIYNKITDPQGEEIKKDIIALGIKNVKEVKTTQLYHLRGDYTIFEIEKITSNILVDSITQDYSVFKEEKIISHPSYKNKKGICSIEVWYKKGITDPVAEATVEAIKDINLFKENLKVNTGIKYVIYGNLKQTEIQKIITKLLVNTLIQEYKIS